MKPGIRGIIKAALQADETLTERERDAFLARVTCPDPRDWISERHAARYLGVSSSQLNRWRRSG